MKKGFTLSEVLITLVVIGVVAALTLPILNNNTRDMELKSKAKKTFAMLTQAMAMSSLQGYVPVYKVVDGDANNLVQWYDKFLDQHLVTLKKCSSSSIAGWESLGGCWSGVTVKGLNNLPLTNADNNGIGTNIIQVVLNDGSFLNITNYSGIYVFFDVNGSRKPNKLGKDIYVAVYDKGTLVPLNEDDCSSSGSGYGCLKVVMEKALN